MTSPQQQPSPAPAVPLISQQQPSLLLLTRQRQTCPCCSPSDKSATNLLLQLSLLLLTRQRQACSCCSPSDKSPAALPCSCSSSFSAAQQLSLLLLTRRSPFSSPLLLQLSLLLSPAPAALPSPPHLTTSCSSPSSSPLLLQLSLQQVPQKPRCC